MNEDKFDDILQEMANDVVKMPKNKQKEILKKLENDEDITKLLGWNPFFNKMNMMQKSEFKGTIEEIISGNWVI